MRSPVPRVPPITRTGWAGVIGHVQSFGILPFCRARVTSNRLPTFRRTGPFTLWAGSLLALSASLLVAWALRPDESLGPCVVAAGPVVVAAIPEASGLAISRRTPGVLWSHNDSGNAAELFALNGAGAMLGRVRVPIRTRDWEDVSAGRCGSSDCLYIADIGDNQSERRQVRIYRVPEPAPGDAETAPPEVFNAKYADEAHNAEAMFVVDSDLFIITRDRNGRIYRSSITDEGSRDLTFRRFGQLGLGAVTDAETSPDKKSVVVRTSREAVLYRTDDLIRGGNIAPYLRIPIGGLREEQGEGVALDGRMLYLASEGRRGGAIVTLRCDHVR